MENVPRQLVPNTPFATLPENQVALALHRRKDVNVYLLKLPNFDPSWPSEPSVRLFNEADTLALNEGIPHVAEDAEITGVADLTIRVTIDFDSPKVKSSRMAVMVTTEKGLLLNSVINGSTLVTRLPPDSVLIAPSEWAKMGLVNSGADPDLVSVVSHGVDPITYRPLGGADRVRLRAMAGWDSSFVFLHVSSMTSNKNVGLMVRAIKMVRQTYPNARLVLKGNDGLYGSADILKDEIEDLKGLVEEGVVEYHGGDLSGVGVAQMMQLSNCYLSPYRYEGFNLPVLEAMAVGLPVVVTGGGSTDDFVRDGVHGYLVEAEVVKKEGAQRVNKRLKGWEDNAWEAEGGEGWVEKAESFELKVDEEDLVRKMEKIIVEEAKFERERKTRGEDVRERYSWDQVVEKIVEAAMGM